MHPLDLPRRHSLHSGSISVCTESGHESTLKLQTAGQRRTMSATHEVDLEEVRPSQRGSILKDMDEIEKMGIPFFAKFFGKKLGGWKNDEGKKENAESVVTADFKKV